MSAAPPQRKFLGDFMAENWTALEAYSDAAAKELDRVSREIPAAFYASISRSINDFLNDHIGKGRIRVRLVIDSNIIVADALGWAKGWILALTAFWNPSLSSLYAPPQIVEEVKEAIEKDLPPKCSKSAAHAHAAKLLARVKIVEPTSSLARAIAQARMESAIPMMRCSWDLPSNQRLKPL